MSRSTWACRGGFDICLQSRPSRSAAALHGDGADCAAKRKWEETWTRKNVNLHHSSQLIPQSKKPGRSPRSEIKPRPRRTVSRTGRREPGRACIAPVSGVSPESTSGRHFPFALLIRLLFSACVIRSSCVSLPPESSTVNRELPAPVLPPDAAAHSKRAAVWLVIPATVLLMLTTSIIATVAAFLAVMALPTSFTSTLPLDWRTRFLANRYGASLRNFLCCASTVSSTGPRCLS